MSEARILDRRETDRIIDTLPRLPDRVAMHQHDALVRRALGEVAPPEPQPTHGGPQLDDILHLIRSRAEGRESTVRGQTLLKIAEDIETTYRAA